MKRQKVKISYSFLKILSGSDLSRRRLPLMAMESINSGPCVWLTACTHGDEVGGIVVIQELFRRLRQSLKRGSVYAFPLMNPIGFEFTTRHIPLSEEDLNRSFPGNQDGSLAERMAQTIFSQIIDKKPSLVLDLHNDWSKSIPYVLVDPKPDETQEEVYKKTEHYAKVCGLINILDTDELKKSLSYNLIRQGVPALAFELGESNVVNEENIAYGVDSIWNILADLKMVGQDRAFRFAGPKPVHRGILKYTDGQLSSTSGIIRFLKQPGGVVGAGEKLAKIYNAFGKLQETIRATGRGIVLGHTDYSATFPGSKVMALGLFNGNKEEE